MNWFQGIDFASLAWRVGTSNRVVLLARQAGNRFLGSVIGSEIRGLWHPTLRSWWATTVLTSFLDESPLYSSWPPTLISHRCPDSFPGWFSSIPTFFLYESSPSYHTSLKSHPQSYPYSLMSWSSSWPSSLMIYPYLNLLFFLDESLQSQHPSFILTDPVHTWMSPWKLASLSWPPCLGSLEEHCSGFWKKSEMIQKEKMGNFPQARLSKQRWGTFHKRDDQNQDGELYTSEMIITKLKLSTSEMIKTKMVNFPQTRLSKQR